MLGKCLFRHFRCILYDSAMCEADVVLVLDTSTSTGWSDFGHMKSFLSTLTEHLINNLNLDSGRITLGLVTFSSTVRPLFNLSSFTTAARIHAAISSFNYSSGATNTAAALAYVRTTMLTSLAGARNNVLKIVAVLTDGKSEDTEATKVPAFVLITLLEIVCLACI